MIEHYKGNFLEKEAVFKMNYNAWFKKFEKKMNNLHESFNFSQG